MIHHQARRTPGDKTVQVDFGSTFSAKGIAAIELPPKLANPCGVVGGYDGFMGTPAKRNVDGSGWLRGCMHMGGHGGMHLPTQIY
jgi:hypothetical protein